jgi:imidazole glycerol-phosphate synthase subunit HisH
LITIVDYGLGNIGAFVNVYKRMNIPTIVARDVDSLKDATHIILPGVGSFDHAMELLNSSGMREALDNLVKSGGVSILGICVGMQILATSSEEGVTSGLGWVEGSVKDFSTHSQYSSLPLPHMGWNDVIPVSYSPLFKGLEKDAQFYFLHSYYFYSDSPVIAAEANYGFNFVCAVNSGNVYGVQFHPEKSHHWGALILKNFAEI